MQACAGEQLADRGDQQEGQRTAIDAHAILRGHVDPGHLQVAVDRQAQLPQLSLDQGCDDGHAGVGVGDAGKFLQRRAGRALQDAPVGKAHLDIGARQSWADRGDPAGAGQVLFHRGRRADAAVGKSYRHRSRYFRLSIKSSMGTAGRVNMRTLPREASSMETRAMVALSGASTMLTKS